VVRGMDFYDARKNRQEPVTEGEKIAGCILMFEIGHGKLDALGNVLCLKEHKPKTVI
jgi:hypothetical protein